jgi:hypothetical protein
MGWGEGVRDGIFVAHVVVGQAIWMGATQLLSAGLLIGYFVSIATRSRNETVAVLPAYLLAIAARCLHFTEEHLSGFERQFPKPRGSEWSRGRSRVFNRLWLAVFVLAALGG